MAAGTLMLMSLLWTPSQLPSEMVALNQRAIQIPIEFNQARRREIRELLLFVSVDQGRNWTQEAVARPTDEAFNFYASRDGVYWFSVCVIDQSGRREPVDISAAPPGLKVLIDTQPPMLRMRSAERNGDDVTVAWEIQESFPELGTLKLLWRPSGEPTAQWNEVPVTPGVNGQKTFRVSTPGPVAVRMTIDDAAKNKAHAMQEVSGPGGRTAVASRGTPSVSAPEAIMTSGNANVVSPPGAPPRDIQPVTGFESAGLERMRPGALRDSNADYIPVASNSGVPVTTRSELKSSTQLVNSAELSLAYEASKLGPSGLRSAKLYMTQDDGSSWIEIAEDRDRKSRISARLPGEGAFGFKLVLESGAGLSKGPPLSGDLPEMRVEVDLTPPAVELYPLTPDPSNPNNLLLRWSAQDKNLAPSPITLEWSENAEGPWRPITSAPLPNSSSYSWRMPGQMPVRVFLRIRARDLAGNVGEARTDKPQLVDISRPEGRLTGIVSTRVQEPLAIDPR